jgi:hypothetical protein
VLTLENTSHGDLDQCAETLRKLEIPDTGLPFASLPFVVFVRVPEGAIIRGSMDIEQAPHFIPGPCGPYRQSLASP